MRQSVLIHIRFNIVVSLRICCTHALEFSLNCTKLATLLTKELCFMHHFTFWALIISRINWAWLCRGLENSDWQPIVDLTQSEELWHNDHEVLGSIPTGGNLLAALIFTLPHVSFCWQLANFFYFKENSIVRLTGGMIVSLRVGTDCHASSRMCLSASVNTEGYVYKYTIPSWHPLMDHKGSFGFICLLSNSRH